MNCEPGTHYWCENTVTKTHSGWIRSNQWLNVDLARNAQYRYQVKARNGDGLETDYSMPIDRYSAIETPRGMTIGTVTTHSIQIQSKNTPTGLDRGQSGLRFENVTSGVQSPWQSNNLPWLNDKLQPNTRYDYRALARNGDGIQTPFGPTLSVYSLAAIPTRPTFTDIGMHSIQVHWGSNGNPPGTLFQCKNTTHGSNSGWTELTTWTNTGLTPNTQYDVSLQSQSQECEWNREQLDRFGAH